MNKKVNKVGLIACSNVAEKRFIPALKGIPNLELYAAGSSSNNKAKDFCIRNNIKKLCTYDDILNDENIDIVYISTPVTLHEELSVKALKQNKHVLCEKPSALSFKSAEKIIEESKINNKVFLQGFMFQFHPQYEYVKNILERGEIGKIKQIISSFNYPKPKEGNIRLNKSLNGGVFWDSFGYPLFLSLMLDKTNVHSISSKRKIDKILEIDTAVESRLIFDSGVESYISASFSDNYTSESIIVGSDGYVKIKRSFSVNKDYTCEVTTISGKDKNTKYIEPVDQFQLMIENFIQSISDLELRNENNSNFLRFHKLLEKINQSF